MKDYISQIQIVTLFDYFIIGFGLYFVFNTLKGTRAAQIVFGLFTLFLFKTISQKLDLTYTAKSLSFLFDNLIIFILIIFQEEIRQIVNRINQKWALIIGKTEKSNLNYQSLITEAVSKLSKEKVGALIVLQGENDLSDGINGGVPLNAEISEELILTIFENYSALHDGAMIIQDNKIIHAAAVLPLSKSKDMNFRFGTRHRAAIGITEEYDCLAIIVSEETGKIRVSEKGKVIDLSEEELLMKINTFYRVKDDSISEIAMLMNNIKKASTKVKEFIERKRKKGQDEK